MPKKNIGDICGTMEIGLNKGNWRNFLGSSSLMSMCNNIDITKNTYSSKWKEIHGFDDVLSLGNIIRKQNICENIFYKENSQYQLISYAGYLCVLLNYEIPFKLHNAEIKL